MIQDRPKVLIIEDDPLDLRSYVKFLSEGRGDYDLHSAESLKQAQDLLKKEEYAVVLTDLRLRKAEEGGFTVIKEVKASYPATLVIVFTGIGGADSANDAIRFGADDYMTKPLNPERLRQVVRNGIEIYEQRRIEWLDMQREGALNRPLPTPGGSFVHSCRSMTDLVDKAIRLAQSDDHLLIAGEPGTGKGLLAECIHLGSERSAMDLVNCGSLSEHSTERILFGDATEQIYSAGVLERLGNGTLILDRIASLSIRLQERLLKAILSGQYSLHPAHPPATINVRLIAINDGDLESSLQQGFFLSELYAQFLQKIEVPPLRRRYDEDGRYRDVLHLANYFIKKYSTANGENSGAEPYSEEAKDIFIKYPFPGNVSELERVIRLALTKSQGGTILPNHLPERMHRYISRPGLGPATKVSRVRCPHGDFSCNQTETIASAYSQAKGIYLRLGKLAPRTVQALDLYFKNLGLIPIRSRDQHLNQVLTPICGVCVSLQSARFAVIDYDFETDAANYELGMLNALGTPTLIISKRGRTYENFSPTLIYEYESEADIPNIIERWVSEHL